MTNSWENPVLQRELRARMRGAKAFWILLAFVGALALTFSIAYWQWQLTANGMTGSFNLGRQLYFISFAVLATLVCLITPALTSGALTLEREMRTYEALEVSLLSRRSIVVGKLLSAVSFVALLLAASLPVTTMSFFLGGVSPGEVAGAYLLLAVSGFVYGALGLALSSFVKTTVGATLLTYVAAVALFLATLTLTVGGSGNAFSGSEVAGRACLVALNPIGAMLGATATEGYFGLTVPAWASALVINGLLGTIFTLVAIHRLEYPKTDRSPLLRGLTFTLTFLMALALTGSFIGNNLLGDSGSDGKTVVAAALCGAGALLAMLFATGNRASGSFLAIKRGEARSGFTFALGTVALCSAIFLVATPQGVWGTWQPVLVALAATFGLGGIGLGASALTRNRWVSMAIVGALTIALFVIPVVEYTTGNVHALDNVLFLSAPAAASDAVNLGSALRSTTKLVSGTTFWEVTVGFYVLLGLIGLGVSRRKS